MHALPGLCPRQVLTKAGFGSLPFVVLDPAGAAERLNCCYPADTGSLWRRCKPLGGDAHCTPGCDGGAFGPTELQGCVEAMQRWKCEGGEQQWCWHAYNELVLDSWRGGGWDRAAMVAAVGIAAGAKAPAVALAREVRAPASYL